MASSSAAPTQADLRQLLRAEVGSRSLRHVSRQVKISPATLRRFIEGGRPLSATLRRMEQWYLLHGPGRRMEGLTGGSALTILRVLAQDVSPARHRRTMEALVKSLGDAYHAAHLPEPAWLGELRQRMDRTAA
jgi:hypothetical protein